MEEILIVTTNEVAGYRITEVYGEVFGLTTRSRNLFSSAGQQMKTVVGGEINGYTKLQHETRETSIDRMREEAKAKGANAIVAMRLTHRLSKILILSLLTEQLLKLKKSKG